MKELLLKMKRKISIGTITPLTLIAAITILLILIGCSSPPKPPIAQVSLNVQPNINLYSTAETKESEARPVVIRFYELTSLATFDSADFFSIFNEYKATLGNELLNSEEFRLIPGQKQKFNRTLHLDTRYVGVVAAFRDLEHSQWRTSVTIPVKEQSPEIYIFLEGNKVLIGAKPECGFFCQFQSPKPQPGTLYEVIE